MSPETHSQLANFIWSICNLLRGPYKRNEYRKVILPLTVLRRFDCLLAPTKAQVLEEYEKIKTRPEAAIRRILSGITERPFYNLSKLDWPDAVKRPQSTRSQSERLHQRLFGQRARDHGAVRLWAADCAHG